MGDRTKWRIWSWLCKVPSVCPAKAHTLVIIGERCDPRVDWMCTDNHDRSGVCWCGKLRNLAREVQ
jgi:hypothetical protein